MHDIYIEIKEGCSILAKFLETQREEAYWGFIKSWLQGEIRGSPLVAKINGTELPAYPLKVNSFSHTSVLFFDADEYTIPLFSPAIIIGESAPLHRRKRSFFCCAHT